MPEEKRITAQAPPRTPEELMGMIADTLHQTVVHYGLWWQQVEKGLGLKETITIEQDVWKKLFGLYLSGLGKILGFEVDTDGIPAALKNMPPEDLQKALDGVSANWLASDGIWFQGIENRHDLPPPRDATTLRGNRSRRSRRSVYERCTA